MYSINPKRQEPVEIVLGGELTIARANELKTVLMAAIAGTETLFIRLEHPVNFDLSFLQILCSLQRTAVTLGKKTFLRGEVPAALALMLRQAGFLPEELSATEPNKASLWLLAA